MNPLPKHPVIYEINTWVWLDDLSRKYQRPVNLATVTTARGSAPATRRAGPLWSPLC